MNVRDPRVVGALCWLFTPAYFAVEVIVAAAWPAPYSFSANAISDLGITRCGEVIQFGGEPIAVCSPWHRLMNLGFVLVGALTAAGAVLLRSVWPQRRLTRVAVAFLVLTGAGGVLIGLAPADISLPLHALGAGLQLPGTVAPLLLVPVLWPKERGVAALSLACGLIGTVGSVFYMTGSYLGLGLGGMERLALWPLTGWTGAVGAVVLLHRTDKLQRPGRTGGRQIASLRPADPDRQAPGQQP